MKNAIKMARLQKKYIIWPVIVLAAAVTVYSIFAFNYIIGLRSDERNAFAHFSTSTDAVNSTGLTVRHVINDAGAAHSGSHRVWIIGKRHWWEPSRVLVSGWSELQDAQQAVQWIGETTFRIELMNGRRDSSTTTYVIDAASGRATSEH